MVPQGPPKYTLPSLDVVASEGGGHEGMSNEPSDADHARFGLEWQNPIDG